MNTDISEYSNKIDEIKAVYNKVICIFIKI